MLQKLAEVCGEICRNGTSAGRKGDELLDHKQGTVSYTLRNFIVNQSYSLPLLRDRRSMERLYFPWLAGADRTDQGRQCYGRTLFISETWLSCPVTCCCVLGKSCYISVTEAESGRTRGEEHVLRLNQRACFCLRWLRICAWCVPCRTF